MKNQLKTLLFVALGVIDLFLTFKFNIDGNLGCFMTCLGVFLIIFGIFRSNNFKEIILGIILGSL